MTGTGVNVERDGKAAANGGWPAACIVLRCAEGAKS